MAIAWAEQTCASPVEAGDLPLEPGQADERLSHSTGGSRGFAPTGQRIEHIVRPLWAREPVVARPAAWKFSPRVALGVEQARLCVARPPDRRGPRRNQPRRGRRRGTSRTTQPSSRPKARATGCESAGARSAGESPTTGSQTRQSASRLQWALAGPRRLALSRRARPKRGGQFDCRRIKPS
jgi:hypothetical protein